MARDGLLLLVQQAHERRHMQQLGRGPKEGCTRYCSSPDVLVPLLGYPSAVLQHWTAI
jgi:hypothetical protein